MPEEIHMAVDRKDIPKLEVEEAKCVEGTVEKSVRQQAGNNYEHLVDESKVLDHKLEIPETNSK